MARTFEIGIALANMLELPLLLLAAQPSAR